MLQETTLANDNQELLGNEASWRMAAEDLERNGMARTRQDCHSRFEA
jgi:hypothetical protein